MKSKKQPFIRRGIVAVFSLLIAACPNTDAFAATYDPVIPDGQTPYIKNTDSVMIPDKYNTGVDPSVALTVYRPSDGGFTINGLKFNGRADMDEIQLDFAHTANIEDGAVYTIENVDFSNSVRLRFVDYQHFGDSNKKVTVIFKNSKFSAVSNENPNPNYNYEFYDCEFDDIGGYNMLIVRAQIHPVTGDAMNPHGHVTVRDTYMYTAAHPESGERHLDGFQTYGRAVADMEYVSFNNVRVEIPKTKALQDNGEWFVSYVNAAAMLAVEYPEHAHDVTLENMHLNGGGYTIYVTCSRDCRSFTDFTFKNVKVGYGHMFGMSYGYHANGVDETAYNAAMENVEHVPALYAGSAWKNSAGVHLSVTNDITEERVLTCTDDSGTTTTHRIAAHPRIIRNMPVEDLPLFSELPYDLDIVVAGASATTVDCYDTTNNTDLTSAPLVRSIHFEPGIAIIDNPTNGADDPDLPALPVTGDSVALAVAGAGTFTVALYSVIVSSKKRR